MQTETFIHRSRINAPAATVFNWHARPGALERLTPPWQSVEVLAHTGGITNGARVVLRMRFGPVKQYWVAEHRDYIEGRQFCDVQVSGPFAHWVHTHRFEPDGPDACYLEDQVEFALPLGELGRVGGQKQVRKMLARLFTYRHRITAEDLATHALWKGAPLNVAVTGASGLVGSALVPFLTTGGHQVTRLVRSQPRPAAAEIHWDPEKGVHDLSGLEGVDAVVHLAGENIASGRWTAEKKARVRNSRVNGTRALCEALTRLSRPPKVLVNASAIGYYGNRGTELLTEESPPGQGFLSEVCQAWEEATAPAVQTGIRVALLRIGLVLSPAGGVLAKIQWPFAFGLGGSVGSGEQYTSWITLDDVIGAIHHVLTNETLRGPVNVTAPQPVTNKEFTATLGRILRRPTILPLPAAALRFALGEMAEELLLSSTRVEPRRLMESHYTFRHPQLEEALRSLLGKP